jgi:WD40 repeat protein
VFAAIIVLVLVANRRSGLAHEVRFPLNNGVAYLFTHGSYLVAVCHDDKIYVWDWNNPSANPRIADVQSDQAVLLESGHIASVKRSGAAAVVVTDLDSGKIDLKIPLAAEGKVAYLKANRSGRTVAAMLTKADLAAAGAEQDVLLVDCNAGIARPVATLGQAAGDKMTGIAVDDNGNLVVLTGDKTGQGYIVLVHMEQKRVVWAEQLSDLQKVRSAVFSTDGKVIYIRGTDSTVQILDTETGKVMKRLLPVSENKSTAGGQQVQTLATSNDGRFMAATISGEVYVWDLKTNKVIFDKWPEHKLVSGIAFSPDSRLLATSDVRQGGTIKIWRIPKR